MMKHKWYLLGLVALATMVFLACGTFSKVADVVSEEVSNVSDVVAAKDFDPEAMAKEFTNLILRPDDLPNQYRIPPGGESRYANKNVLNEMGEIQAKQYFLATKRVDGWRIEMERVNKEDIAPAHLESTLTIYETSDGAAAALTPDWFKAYKEEDREIVFDEGCDVGDECLFYHSQRYDPANEITVVTYEVAFRYRNVVVWILARGLDIDMSPDYVLNVAQIAFNKLQEYEKMAE